ALLRGAKFGVSFQTAKLFSIFFFFLFLSPPELLSLGAGCKGKKHFPFRRHLFQLFFLFFPGPAARRKLPSGSGCKGKQSFENRNTNFQFFSFSSQAENHRSKRCAGLYALRFSPSHFPVPAEPGCKSKKGFILRKGER
ncbi:hypothetical protein ACFSRY_02200, partial [Pontibacter locisalis]